MVGYPHDIKGTGIHAYAIVRPEFEGADRAELAQQFRQQVRHEIGPIAVPDRIQIVPGLPKTRSGKIMRRILRKIAEGAYDQLGDVSTLADPSVVDVIVADHKVGGPVAVAPPTLTTPMPKKKRAPSKEGAKKPAKTPKK